VKKLIHKIFLVINLIFALSLLISYLSVYISPEDFILPAFFGLAYPYLLIINIIFVVIWAVKLRPEAFISIGIILVGFNHFSDYIQLFKTKEGTQGNILVMSYNIRLFNYYKGSGKENTENEMLNLVRLQQPDILCLQEFFINGEAKKKDDEIKKKLGGDYNSHIKLIGSGKNKSYGIATYIKYKIVNRGDISFPGSSSLSIFTDIIVENDTFRIFNSHLQSFRLKKTERSFFEELFEKEDKQKIREILTLSNSLRKGFAERSFQARKLKDYIINSPYPVIVTGDFNDTPISYTYRKIRKGLKDSFVVSGYGAGFTYWGNYPPNRIDYILYDDTLESTKFEILRVKYSDHYPIMAWFRKAN